MGLPLVDATAGKKDETVAWKSVAMKGLWTVWRGVGLRVDSTVASKERNLVDWKVTWTVAKLGDKLAGLMAQV